MQNQRIKLMQRNSIVLMALALITLSTLPAAPARAVEQEGGVRLMVGVPRGEFDDSLDNESFGVELHYGVRPATGWTFGVGGNIMSYGSESRRYSHPLVDDYEIETSNNMAAGFLFAQWRPLQGAVQPYLEARAGLRYLWTESKIKDDDWWDWDEEVARKTNFDDSATFYGGSVGMLIQLKDSDQGRKQPGVFLDAKVSLVQGGEAEYLAEGDIEIVNDRPVFEPRKSNTDMTTYQLGVVLTF